MSDEPLDIDEDDEDDPWIVATCPVGPELAAQIAGMAELDWEDVDITRKAMTDAGWRPNGGYLGDLNEKAYTLTSLEGLPAVPAPAVPAPGNPAAGDTGSGGMA
ncbi:hypothetical protein ACH4E7_07320 [Kitasatospora sp. NPDC018058]|uniref:hypothetical protein n=1 Tax=Kitasatospora sp. NPDC018058 TaxID=3364025 RepID=UPI0037C05404